MDIKQLKDLAERITPLDRALVSDGYDRALEIIAEKIPLKVHEIESGEEVWTWIVPEKWTVNHAYFSDGEKKYCNYADHPLHLMSYSMPFKGRVPRSELLKHVHTNPNCKNEIPYRYKFYDRDWGFCMKEEDLKSLDKDYYEVDIDTTFGKGSMKIGEYHKKGRVDDCFVFMAHLDHPCQFNDGLSGVLASISLVQYLESIETHYSYRILIFPETVGSIAYLSQNENLIPYFKGAVASEMLAVDQKISIQHSYDSSSYIDTVVCKVLDDMNISYREGDYLKVLRNDEKIFNSPGVMIPSLSITRSNFPGEKDFPIHGYHTSFDNLKNSNFSKLEEICKILKNTIKYLEADFIPKRNFKGQIMLSRYNLFIDPSIDRKAYNNLEKLMWFLEGDKSVVEISKELDLNFNWLRDYLLKYQKNKLVSFSKKTFN